MLRTLITRWRDWRTACRYIHNRRRARLTDKSTTGYPSRKL